MFIYYAILCSNIGGNSEEMKRMAKLKLDTKKLTEAISALVPDTTDRVLLASEQGKTVEITAEYDDDDDSVYYIMSLCRLSNTVFSSFAIRHTLMNSRLIMMEGRKVVGELMLNPFSIVEITIKGENVTEAFA